METSSKASQWAALAATAFISASVVAASAFLLHKRFVDSLNLDGSYPLPPTRKALDSKGRRKTLKSAVRSSSSSLSENVAHDNNEQQADQSKATRSYSKFDSDIASIPSGLRRVQTQREGLIESFCLVMDG